MLSYFQTFLKSNWFDGLTSTNLLAQKYKTKGIYKKTKFFNWELHLGTVYLMENSFFLESEFQESIFRYLVV